MNEEVAETEPSGSNELYWKYWVQYCWLVLIVTGLRFGIYGYYVYKNGLPEYQGGWGLHWDRYLSLRALGGMVVFLGAIGWALSMLRNKELKLSLGRRIVLWLMIAGMAMQLVGLGVLPQGWPVFAGSCVVFACFCAAGFIALGTEPDRYIE